MHEEDWTVPWVDFRGGHVRPVRHPLRARLIFAAIPGRSVRQVQSGGRADVQHSLAVLNHCSRRCEIQQSDDAWHADLRLNELTGIERQQHGQEMLALDVSWTETHNSSSPLLLYPSAKTDTRIQGMDRTCAQGSRCCA